MRFKKFTTLFTILIALFFATSVFAGDCGNYSGECMAPAEANTGRIGTENYPWGYGYFKYIDLNGITYTFPAADGSASQVLTTNGSGTLSWGAAGAATAFDDIGDPDADSTLVFGNDEILSWTFADVNEDMLNIQGIGNFADVSVVRIEQITGNPTDGTVLEVVAADANVDPLVVSASGKTNALVVGQNTGVVTIAGVAEATAALVITAGDITVSDGDINITAGDATFGEDLTVAGTTTITQAQVTFTNGSEIHTDTVALTNANIKALKATPITLIAAQGANTIIEFISAVIVMDYGSEALTETSDNLVIEFEDGRDITAAIETTGFLDQTADQVAMITAADIPTMTAAHAVNKSIRLLNTGDGEIGGNASNDTVLTIRVSYRVHAVTL